MLGLFFSQEWKGVYLSIINQSVALIGIVGAISAFFPLFFPIAVAIMLLFGYLKIEREIEDTSVPESFNYTHQPTLHINTLKKQEYIRSSPIWNQKRKERLKIDRYTCYDCGAATNLEVHHITYKRLYKEEMEDLVSLCRSCHDAIHKKYGYKYSDTFPPLKYPLQLDI